jgi:hypothetical protein
MIRVTVLYPSDDGKKFDHDYYVKKHMTLVQERLKSFGIVRTEVDKRVAGEIMADIANYTNIQPQIQISEIIG